MSQINGRKGSLLLILGVVAALLLLLVAGVLVYFKYFLLAYSDSKYGFLLRNQQGWYSVPHDNNVYYALGTKDPVTDKVVSTFTLSPVIHSKNPYYDMTSVKKNCLEISGNLSDVSNVAVNNLSGFVCTYKAKPENVDLTYVIKLYYLINPNKSFDYVISTSYPEGNITEEEKVARVINNFYAK